MPHSLAAIRGRGSIRINGRSGIKPASSPITPIGPRAGPFEQTLTGKFAVGNRFNMLRRKKT
jgi:hypothetical protein